MPIRLAQLLEGTLEFGDARRPWRARTRDLPITEVARNWSWRCPCWTARAPWNTAGHPNISGEGRADVVFVDGRMFIEYARRTRALIKHFATKDADW